MTEQVHKAPSRQGGPAFDTPVQAPRRRRVFLADDDRQLRQLVASSLAYYGYEVEQMGSGLALNDQLRHAKQDGMPPDLLIADYRMPGLTGLDILRTIRGWHWDTPFLMITAFDDEEVLDEARRLGADAVLMKPFDMADLSTLTLYLLRRSSQQRRGPKPSILD